MVIIDYSEKFKDELNVEVWGELYFGIDNIDQLLPFITNIKRIIPVRKYTSEDIYLIDRRWFVSDSDTKYYCIFIRFPFFVLGIRGNNIVEAEQLVLNLSNSIKIDIKL